jgi:hypothetical protein
MRPEGFPGIRKNPFFRRVAVHDANPARGRCVMKDGGKYRGTKEYHLVYSELIQAARYRGLITYGRVAAIMGLPPSGNHMAAEIGKILGEIVEEEHGQGRPMLSAIVVGAEGGPGEGFYSLARDLGKLKADSPEARRRFWEKERNAAYREWERPPRKTLPESTLHAGR